MDASSTRDANRRKGQWYLGVCRIRRKEISPKSDVTRGCGFLVKDLIIPNPDKDGSGSLTYKYCLVTTGKVIDANDRLEDFCLEFRKLNSELKKVPLGEIAKQENIHITCKLVFIRIEPSKKYPKKQSIFDYRPFKVTDLNRSDEDLMCCFVEDYGESFNVTNPSIKRRIEQKSPSGYFQVIEDRDISTTESALSRNGNRKPYGGVILKRLGNRDKEYIVAGCLNFADDEARSICPVFFPLPYTGKSNTEEDNKLKKENIDGASGGVLPPPTPSIKEDVTLEEGHIPRTTPSGRERPDQERKRQPLPSGAEDGQSRGKGGSQPSVPGVTATPIQEERPETETANLTPEGAEDLRNEETAAQGDTYEQSFVSEQLVLPKYKELYDKLVRALDNTANRAIANWEHLACTEEVDAPSLVRLKCKLSTNYSHTQMLFEVLAVRENEEVITVKDLIAALRSIQRNDIVKMITDVHCEDNISPKPIKDFMDCASNQDLLDRIITGLDDQTSRAKKHWKHLGFELVIPKKKLEVIEFCAPFNPTKGLMEYLLSAEQSFTVGKFCEKVRQKFKHVNVLTMLEPLLKEGCNQDKLMKDVIDLDNEYVDAFYVCLNKMIPGIENWKDLARAFDIPHNIYNDFNPKEPRSPTKHLFEWLFANRTELTVGQLCSALERIKRNDLVGDVKKCFEQCSS